MSGLIKPLNATSVGAPGAAKNVVGMTLMGALAGGNMPLAQAALGISGRVPQGGVDAGQNNVSLASQDDDDSEQ